MMAAHKKALEPYADLLEQMYKRAEATSTCELITLEEGCCSVTGANCSWSTFRAAQIMLIPIREELLRRRRRQGGAS